MKRWGDATGKMVAGETVGRTDGRTVDMTESESGEEESGEGREKGGSFDLHGGREGRRQSPIRSICRLGGRRKGDENRGGEKCHPSVSIAPRRTRQRMKPLLKQTAGFTIALERIFIPVGFFNTEVWPHWLDFRPGHSCCGSCCP